MVDAVYMIMGLTTAARIPRVTTARWSYMVAVPLKEPNFASDSGTARNFHSEVFALIPQIQSCSSIFDGNNVRIAGMVGTQC